MDAAKKKALFRAKLNAQQQKKDNRIDSPLVRYNELDQPVCRVCNLVLKSESQWDAHQASRKHHEAITNLKANATATIPADSAKPEQYTVLMRPPPARDAKLHDDAKSEPLVPKPQSSSALPPDFFDNCDSKKQKTDTAKSLKPDLCRKPGVSVQTMAKEVNRLPSGNDAQTKPTEIHAQSEIAGSDAKQAKGALPEGFFDNKEADLRARGIKPIKLDVKDEYKEFEKLIQEDLQEVDDRLEEEEIDAAETIEEAESLEQRSHRVKVELLRKKRVELMAARSAKRSRGSSEIPIKESNHEDSSSDDDDSDENFAVDWRAQHL